MSSQQTYNVQSSKKLANRNLRTHRPLAPKPLKPSPSVAATRPLAPKPSVVTIPLAPKPSVTARPFVSNSSESPLGTPKSLLQNQKYSNEMVANPNFLMEYRTDTLMTSRPNIRLNAYQDVETNEVYENDQVETNEVHENDQEVQFYEEDTPVDILNMKSQSFSEEGLMVSIKS
jgi:hypothetical protein